MKAQNSYRSAKDKERRDFIAERWNDFVKENRGYPECQAYKKTITCIKKNLPMVTAAMARMRGINVAILGSTIRKLRKTLKKISLETKSMKKCLNAHLNKITIILIITFLFGCAESNNSLDCKISSKAVSRLQEIAIRFANDNIVSSENLLESHWITWIYKNENNSQILEFEFYNKQLFPDQSQLTSALGGCPSYFSVTVEIVTGNVIEHYCSRR